MKSIFLRKVWDSVEEKLKLFRETGKNPKLFRNPGYRMTALYTALTMSVEFQAIEKHLCFFLGELDNWTLGPCELNAKL